MRRQSARCDYCANNVSAIKSNHKDTSQQYFCNSRGAKWRGNTGDCVISTKGNNSKAQFSVSIKNTRKRLM